MHHSATSIDFNLNWNLDSMHEWMKRNPPEKLSVLFKVQLFALLFANPISHPLHG